MTTSMETKPNWAKPIN